MHRVSLFCVALLCSGASADPVRLPNTDVVYLKAKANDVEYKLYISYPRDFKTSKTQYPLVVSLDADYSFAIIRNIVEHLADRRDTPPMVIASIAYAGETTQRNYRMNRSRDYTPVFDPDDGYGAEFQRQSGGAPDFLAFIRDELLPFMTQHYRASGRQALVGHSYGGLFASYVMLTEPALFDGHVIVSPSLWYHDKWIFGYEEKTAKGQKQLAATAYLAVGDFEGGSMVPDLEAFTIRLQAREFDGFTVRGDVLTDETHNSVFPRAVSNGIRMIWPRETGRAWAAASGQ